MVCCGNTLVAENGSGKYFLRRSFPGVPPWGPAQLLSPSGRYVFAWWLFFTSCPLLAAVQRQSGCLGHGIWGTADHETSTDNSGHLTFINPPSPRNCQSRTHAPCRLVAVLIPARRAELRATQSRLAEHLGPWWRITCLAGYCASCGGTIHGDGSTEEKCWLQFSRIVVCYLASYCACKG